MSEYSDEVDALTTSFLEMATPARFVPLAILLGCGYVRYGSEHRNAYFPAQPAAINENDACQALLRLLDQSIACGFLPTLAFGVLGGVAKSDRWRNCLQKVDLGYALAMSLIQWVAAPNDPHIPTERTNQVRAGMTDDVMFVLNEWLAPPAPWKEAPRRDVLVEAFFGPAWCAIMDVAAMPTAEVVRLIHSTRPAFVPGVLPGLGQSLSQLPALL
jgi:hypothetical protein